MSFKTPSNLSCSLTAEWLMWAHRTFRVKAEGAVTTARQNSKETSTYNGHLRYEHPPDGVGHAARNISVQRAEPRANAAPAARPAAPPAACPGLGPPRRPPRPSRCAPSPQPASGRATPAAAHARSVFSMMNLTFSSVSSVMRTVGWLAYGMAAPDGALLGRRRTPPAALARPLPARRTRPTQPAAGEAEQRRAEVRVRGFIGAAGKGRSILAPVRLRSAGLRPQRRWFSPVRLVICGRRRWGTVRPRQWGERSRVRVTRNGPRSGAESRLEGARTARGVAGSMAPPKPCVCAGKCSHAPTVTAGGGRNA